MLFLLELRKICKQGAICTENSRRHRKDRKISGEGCKPERASAKIPSLALVLRNQGSKGSLVVRRMSKREMIAMVSENLEE